MINDIFSVLSEALTSSLIIAALAAFAWGVLSIILSPCHLSSIPLIIGFLSNQDNKTVKNTFMLSLIFSLGILFTIALIGVVTYSLGRLMGDTGVYSIYIVVVIFVIIGLYFLDIIKIPWNSKLIRPLKAKGGLAAFLLGLLFGVALGPCAFAFLAPVLSIVMQYSVTKSALPWVLLSSFGLGHCLVLTAAGTLTTVVQKYLKWSEDSKALVITKKVCGVLMICAAIYMIINN
ncbi:MAG: cytochrome c biogenesis protein CcdA [Bacteroidota bacterium]|nr:cytochrome c biogenesis protein CcdA [Bacteroidota bacterium]